MLQTYLDELTNELSKDERLVNSDGKLLKSRIADYAKKLDEKLVASLLANDRLQKFFFKKVGEAWVFDQQKFMSFVYNEAFLGDSYTAYKNKIGLATSRDDFVSSSNDVVLNWPYKDCVLEGGQDKEDQKRDEIFWNETLGADQQDVLLAPKVLTGFKRYDATGEHDVTELSENDNFLLRGNNLLVLHTLKKRFASKVKLIYIDPPYNTGNDGFNYNDRFNHSTWLTFMKNRLVIAKELLAQDGSIYIQLDYNEVHYCKVLMDEIFGNMCFQREIIWSNETSSGYKAQAQNWIRGHDSILFYSKSQNFEFHKIFKTLDENTKKRYDKTDEKGRKYKLYLDGGNERRVYLDTSNGKPLSDVWTDIIGFQTANRGGETLGFEGQKSEALLLRIIKASTSEGDIVLDYHLGSGTTCAVSHKIGRRYIGIEQMDYGELDAVTRLNKVIRADSTGISKSVGWMGGGSFVYALLKNDANSFIELVQKATSSKELESLLQTILASNFLSYRVDPKSLHADDFKTLPIHQQKQILIDLLDKNKLYVNYQDMDDPTYKVDETTKALNRWMQSRG